MDCINNLVGLPPTCETDTAPANDITDLEVLSGYSIAANTDEKFITAKAAVIKKGNKAASDILQALKNEMQARGYRFKSFADTGGKFGKWTEKTQSGLQVGDNGLVIFRGRLYPTHLPFKVQTIYLKTSVDIATQDIKFTDSTGNVQHTETVENLIAGVEKQVQINRDFYVDSLRIVADNSNWLTYLSDVGMVYGCCGQMPRTSGSHSTTQLFANGLINGALGYMSPGISADVSLSCPDGILCQYVADLKPAILYRAGMELLKEWQASKRLNLWTLDKDWVAMKIAEWGAISDEYLGAVIPAILEDMKKKNHYCIDCWQPISTKPALP